MARTSMLKKWLWSPAKKAKENLKKKNFSKFKNSDREQFSGCFKCGKLDHIVKNCPLLKEAQEAEQSKKHGLELFLWKVTKVWTKQGEVLLNPI